MNTLRRFVDAQDFVWPRVLDELRRGRKETHWMWFVFPQIAGLGFSERAQRYAIASLAEARDYLAHTVLGSRLAECTRLVLGHPSSTAHEIFGSPDDLKFRSSMTLFAAADPTERTFTDALGVFFSGVGDPRTLEILDGDVTRRQP